jgi:hypothetical protein
MKTITTDQNISVTTNLLQFTIDSVSIEAGGNVSLAAGAEQELQTEVNSVTIDIPVTVVLVGSQLNTFLSSVDAQAVTIAYGYQLIYYKLH